MAVSKVRALGSEAMVIDGRDRFFTLTFPLPQKELMMREETLRVGLEACGWSLGTLRLGVANGRGMQLPCSPSIKAHKVIDNLCHTVL
jgi:hypothetical protein